MSTAVPPPQPLAESFSAPREEEHADPPPEPVATTGGQRDDAISASVSDSDGRQAFPSSERRSEARVDAEGDASSQVASHSQRSSGTNPTPELASPDAPAHAREFFELEGLSGYVTLTPADRTLKVDVFDRRQGRRFAPAPIKLDSITLEGVDKEQGLVPKTLTWTGDHFLVAGTLPTLDQSIVLCLFLSNSEAGPQWVRMLVFYRGSAIAPPKCVLAIPQQPGRYAVLDETGSVYLMDMSSKAESPFSPVISSRVAPLLKRATTLAIGAPNGVAALRTEAFELQVLAAQGKKNAQEFPVVIAYDREGDGVVEEGIYLSDKTQSWERFPPKDSK